MNKPAFILFIPILLFSLASLNAKEIDTPAEPSSHSFPEQQPDSFAYRMFGDTGRAIFENSGWHNNRFMIWGGAHKHLYGYEDLRYRSGADDPDQNDYLTTDASYGGMELYVTSFPEISDSMTDARFGFNAALYRHGEFSPKNLEAVPLHNIEEETVPDEGVVERHGKWWCNLGVFAGIDKRWLGFDLGLTLRSTLINEKTRYRLDPASDPANPTYSETTGRGLLFDDAYLVPNLYIRLGQEDIFYTTLSFLREDYDPAYGSFMCKVVFPFTYASIAAGGYFWQAQAVFLEPTLRLWGLEIAVRAGLYVNYPESELSRVAISDSAFGGASMSYNW